MPAHPNRHLDFKYFQLLNKCYDKIQPLEEVTPDEPTLEENKIAENLKLNPKHINIFKYCSI